jgi:single-stranded-DNA-specific exonuclease
VLEPRYRWAYPREVAPDPSLMAVVRERGLPERIAPLLAARGIETAAELRAFLGPPEDALLDPGLLPDADAFVDRLARARRDHEGVLVFGDFDADGLSGLAVMIRALRGVGIEATPYVPSRLDEGHGLSLAAVQTAAGRGDRVIVTVDCGSTSRAEVAAAAERGIDVLVTDHHRVPADPPAAAALVNPHRPDSTYPFRELSGSGVAFKLAELLLARLGSDRRAAIELADLAAIGIVSDVAPLVGECRAIVRLGLERMRTGPRPGIAALLARAGIAPSRVDVDVIGYQLAPRLNAAGRMGEAMDAADLLLADTADAAEILADRLDAANQARREQTRVALAAARTAPDAVDGAPATVIRGPWPVGIVGLVAGRLADELGRPAVVGAELGDVVRASCRGDGRLHLAEALASCDDLLIRHGGHAAAAGFEIPAERWEAFRSRFAELAARVPPVDGAQPLDLALALPAAEVDYALHRALEALAPCGPGNPLPIVAVLGLTVTRARAANGGHTQLVLRRERDVIDGIAFGWESLASAVREGDRVDVAARLSSRAFGGYESLQLEIRDVVRSGTHPEADLILDGARTGALSGVRA